MAIALTILAVLLTLILVLLVLPIRIYLDYKKDETKNEASLILGYAFLKFDILNREKKPKAEKEKKEPEEAEEPEEKQSDSFEEKRDKVSRYIKIFEETKDDVAKVLDYTASRAVVIEKIYTDIEFGFSDAMHTGIFTGVLNGFVYGVLGFIHHHSNLRDMKVNIQPNFESPCFKVDAGCIVRLKNVHIIIVAINLLKILRKIRKIERSK